MAAQASTPGDERERPAATVFDAAAGSPQSPAEEGEEGAALLDLGEGVGVGAGILDMKWSFHRLPSGLPRADAADATDAAAARPRNTR